VKLVLPELFPLLSAGETPIVTPLAGMVELTVREKTIGDSGRGVESVPFEEPLQPIVHNAKQPAVKCIKCRERYLNLISTIPYDNDIRIGFVSAEYWDVGCAKKYAGRFLATLLGVSALTGQSHLL
jgi:hypothetical protein